MPKDGPTETSPLLAGVSSPGEHIQSGEATIGPLAGENNGNGNFKPRDDEANRTENIDGARESQFEGMPEVKKQLKFIVPAVGIGVCIVIPILEITC